MRGQSSQLPASTATITYLLHNLLNVRSASEMGEKSIGRLGKKWEISQQKEKSLNIFCFLFSVWYFSSPSRRLFRAIFNEHLIVFRTIFSFFFFFCLWMALTQCSIMSTDFLWEKIVNCLFCRLFNVSFTRFYVSFFIRCFLPAMLIMFVYYFCIHQKNKKYHHHHQFKSSPQKWASLTNSHTRKSPSIHQKKSSSH